MGAEKKGRLNLLGENWGLGPGVTGIVRVHATRHGKLEGAVRGNYWKKDRGGGGDCWPPVDSDSGHY